MSIHTAYVNAIRAAQHFIYIENQYFLGSSFNWDSNKDLGKHHLQEISFVGIIIICILGLIGFVIGTFKMPDSTAFEITKKTGGENIDDVIRRFVKFKMQKNKIYVYKKDNKMIKEETKDE